MVIVRIKDCVNGMNTKLLEKEQLIYLEFYVKKLTKPRNSFALCESLKNKNTKPRILR